MRKDKQKAIELRKSGLSYLQIKNQLSIPKSTLSTWLKDLQISADAKDKILKRAHQKSVAALIKRNKKQTEIAKTKALKIIEQAKSEASKLSKDKLFLIGVSLYWAEGYKKGAQGSKWKNIDFANSDPVMIELVMKFFRKYLKTDETKFRAQVIAHSNLNIEKSVEFWSKITKIPQNQFIKTSISSNKSKIPKHGRILTNGTIHIRINDVALFFRVIGWVEFLKTNSKIGV